MDKKQTSPELSQAGLPPPTQVPANSLSRKRQLDSDDDAETQTKRARTTRTTRPTSEPARLTRKNLALFNKMGKKKSSDPSDDSGSTRTISTTASGFAIQARKNGILDPRSSKPPPDLEDLRKRLVRSRETASPPESAYGDYIDQVERAKNEATMVFKTSGRLLKEYPKGCDQAFNQAFTGYPKDVGFNNGLSAPQPDFVEGLEMEEYLPFPVNERIPGAVLYKDDPHSLTLSHLAGEWKGSGKDIEEARMQAAYDGAALVYARNQALNAAKKPTGHAQVTTFTTDGRNLNLFAHYATETEDGTLEYHQYPIKSLNLMDSHEGYKEGRKHLRNAQDYAREQSYALRDQLKEYYKQQRSGGLHPVAEEVPSLPVPGIEPLDDNYEEEEEEEDYEIVEPQPVYQPMPPTSSKHKSSTTHSHHSQHSHSTPHSSKAPSSTHSSTHSSSGKRKASTSQSSSHEFFRTRQQAQKLLEEGRQERTLLPPTFGWYHLLV